jgi:hypothetical protein
MAFGASSKIFSSFVHDSVNKTGTATLSSATAKAALYNDSITPNQVVTSANASFGAGVWTNGSSPNVQDTGTGAPAGWPWVGRPLAWGSATKLTTYADATLKYDSDDTVSASATTTLLTVFGCLVYDDASTTTVDQGFCYISFNGTQSVTLGTFTIVWSGSGIMSIAM